MRLYGAELSSIGLPPLLWGSAHLYGSGPAKGVPPQLWGCMQLYVAALISMGLPPPRFGAESVFMGLRSEL